MSDSLLNAEVIQTILVDFKTQAYISERVTTR